MSNKRITKKKAKQAAAIRAEVRETRAALRAEKSKITPAALFRRNLPKGHRHAGRKVKESTGPTYTKKVVAGRWYRKQWIKTTAAGASRTISNKKFTREFHRGQYELTRRAIKERYGVTDKQARALLKKQRAGLSKKAYAKWRRGFLDGQYKGAAAYELFFKKKG